MQRNLTKSFNSILEYPFFSRIRRNHGLEHATLHILARRFPKTAMAGHSNPGGFWIIGDLDTQEVRAAVEEALDRLRAGENHLAVHPNCGTNMVVAGVSAGLVAALAMLRTSQDRSSKLERFPLAVTLATVALLAAQPLGMTLQARVTTSGEPGGLQVVEVTSKNRGRLKAHRVITRG